MAYTGRQLITDALKKAGVIGDGQTASASETADGLRDVNDMLSQWRVNRWMVFTLMNIGYTSLGVSPMTVGPAGNFNVDPAPNRIQAARVVQLNNAGLRVSTPLKVVEAMEQWNNLATPGLVSYPQAVFLETDFPVANLHVYPIPSAALYEIRIVLKDVIPLLSLNGDVESVYPKHYIPGIKFQAAKIFRQAYGKRQPDEELNRLAGNGLRVIKRANVQVPELNMPSSVLVPGYTGSGYNIYSDQWSS